MVHKPLLRICLCKYARRPTQEYFTRICVNAFAQLGLRTTAYGV